MRGIKKDIKEFVKNQPDLFENCYSAVFGTADCRFKKFIMADSIWRSRFIKMFKFLTQISVQRAQCLGKHLEVSYFHKKYHICKAMESIAPERIPISISGMSNVAIDFLIITINTKTRYVLRGDNVCEKKLLTTIFYCYCRSTTCFSGALYIFVQSIVLRQQQIVILSLI